MSETTAAPSRNARCPCGSGRRYKECHGREAVFGTRTAPDAAPGIEASMRRAIEAQKAKRPDEAERHYRHVLALVPDEADALHMLGVLRYEQGDARTATDLVLRALDLTDWRVPFMRTNLGLILSKRAGGRDDAETAAMVERYGAMLAERRAGRRAVAPLVSVVMPTYNHARYVGRALASVLEQTYRPLELIVIDDGSTDATPAEVESHLRDIPLPHRFVQRENRGAPQTLNEGIALASGEYVQFLNSDDWLVAPRVERMVAEVAGCGAQWGYSAIELADAAGEPIDLMRDRRGFDLMCSTSAVPFRTSVGFSLVPSNTVVSSGNLFVARTLAERIGGFRDHRYNHDWDFCLRALWHDEPVFVRERLYGYRIHGGNTIAESAELARSEMTTITTGYLTQAMRADANPPNRFAPAMSTWGAAFLNTLLSSGIAGLVDPAFLRSVARAKLERSTATHA